MSVVCTIGGGNGGGGSFVVQQIAMLMFFFEEILKVILAHNTARFLLIWITITTAAAICVTLAVGQAASQRNQKATKRPTNLSLTWRQVGTSRAVAALTLLAVFLAFYIAMTLWWEDFAYFDNEMFTQTTLKGHNIYMQIKPETGRFLPLALQEFNLIRHFTNRLSGIMYCQLSNFCSLFLFSCFLMMRSALQPAWRSQYSRC